MSLSGSRILLVGGSSGIGLAVAVAAAAQGATPIVASRRRESVDRALASLPAGAEGATVDLADPESVAGLLDAAGHVDHLVYTAGEPLELVTLEDLTPELARRFFETRYFGALAVARAAAPRLAPGGSITLTSGTAGERPGPGWAIAASICGAVTSLTKALAMELAPLRVNAVAPGVLRSPLWAGMSEEDRAGMYSQIGAGLPLGRVGEVEEAAEAYLYLMAQSYGTGVVLTVDGGTVLA